MDDPNYEAIRARERAEAERERAAADLVKSAVTFAADLIAGRAGISVTPDGAAGWNVRFVRDPPR